MKKLIIAVFAAIILAPMFTSCNKGENKCYLVSYTTPAHKDADGKTVGSIEFSCYKWINSKDVDTYKSELEGLNYQNVKVIPVADIDEDHRNKSMTDCLVPGEM